MMSPGCYSADVCVGGFGLADWVVEYCGFVPGNRLADIGCGNCETANRLAARYGLYVSCVDISPRAAPEICDDKVRFFNAPAEKLPFAGATFDGVMFECSASLMDDPGAAFREAGRVLSPGGYMSVSDFFVSGGERGAGGERFDPPRLERWLNTISKADFEILSVRERTGTVLEFWGQMILDHGIEETSRRLGLDAKTRSPRRHRYFLTVARKGDSF